MIIKNYTNNILTLQYFWKKYLIALIENLVDFNQFIQKWNQDSCRITRCLINFFP